MVSVALVAINSVAYVCRSWWCIDVAGEWPIIWVGSGRSLLEFFDFALGAMVVHIGAMDVDEVIV